MFHVLRQLFPQPGCVRRTEVDLEVRSVKTDLLTELPDLIPRASPVSSGRVARFRGHGQRRGCAAGVVAVGGAAARIAGSDGGSVRAVSAGRRRRGGDRCGGVVLRGVVGLWTAGGDRSYGMDLLRWFRFL